MVFVAELTVVEAGTSDLFGAEKLCPPLSRDYHNQLFRLQAHSCRRMKVAESLRPTDYQSAFPMNGAGVTVV